MFRSQVGTFRIWQRVDPDTGKESTNYHHPMRLLPTYKKEIRRKADEAADDTQKEFIFKNAKKLGMLVKNKGVAMDDPKIIHLSVGGRGFHGEILFKFDDGSKFTVRNKVVWKQNNYGTVFNQYPTTFHDVVMPDGKPMSMPSEERMNRVFCNKPDAGFHV
jgi:hypothetical protein